VGPEDKWAMLQKNLLAEVEMIWLVCEIQGVCFRLHVNRRFFYKLRSLDILSRQFMDLEQTFLLRMYYRYHTNTIVFLDSGSKLPFT
jgi:hypothetical protein